MIIADRLLQQRAAKGKPIHLALIGAGAMARGMAKLMLQRLPGFSLDVIYSRTPEKGAKIFTDCDRPEPREINSAADLEAAIEAGVPAITTDPLAAVQAGPIDVVVEATGSIEFAAKIILEAFAHGKDTVLMNAEIDATIGPILQHRAQKAGVIYTGCDGDQPGVELNLVRFVRSIGLEPLVAGSMKGMLDTQRTPETQRGWAEKWNQNVNMVTSFADGSKLCFEQAIVANALGWRVARRGMIGPDHPGHIDGLTGFYDINELRAKGPIVDYALRSVPGPGVYVMAACDDPEHKQYLNLYKLGEGPLYCFYTPYHLCYFEVPNSIARVALSRDPVIQPIGRPYVDVVTIAKKELHPGERLDGIGGFTCYGVAENSTSTYQDRLLPMGQSEGATVKRTISAGTALTLDDIEFPTGRISDSLRQEQNALFGNELAQS